MTPVRTWLTPDSRSRRVLVGLAVYLTCTAVFAGVAGAHRLSQHTQFNHYALQAEAWLHGRNDLPGGPPRYTENNDFASFGGKTFVSFPPFPAVVMLPLVAASGGAENFRDGQFIVWLAGLGPSLLFLVLEKLRRTGRSTRREWENALLACLFAFGSVYFFTAVEGTVWFAAHVVSAALVSGFLLCALDAERPALAGLLLACSFASRPVTSMFAVVLAAEAARVSFAGTLPEGSLRVRLRAFVAGVDRGALARRCVAFALPILPVLALCSAWNHARFGNWSPTAFGHEHLSVAWHDRMLRWGLFSYHYLGKNLACVLTILPWFPARGTAGAAPFQINEHGLALWFTTPIYLWLFRPRVRTPLHDLLALAVIGPALMLLLYQNTGWRQFGYRFSNDYAPLLFVLLALGQRPFRWLFAAAATWGVVANSFGAATFDRGDPRADRFYFRDPSQVTVYQPD